MTEPVYLDENDTIVSKEWLRKKLADYDHLVEVARELLDERLGARHGPGCIGEIACSCGLRALRALIDPATRHQHEWVRAAQLARPDGTDPFICEGCGAFRDDPATPEPDNHGEAKCVCGRDIFRPWINGIQEPWKHWVEPLDHPATPEPVEGEPNAS
jgi:hypothetical protein